MFQKDHHAIDILLAEIDIYELFAFKHCKGRRVKLALCEGNNLLIAMLVCLDNFFLVKDDLNVFQTHFPTTFLSKKDLQYYSSNNIAKEMQSKRSHSNSSYHINLASLLSNLIISILGWLDFDC